MNNTLSVSPAISKGRLYDEFEETPTSRTPFERDRDRIIHSSSFRKLKHKTQVFIESDSDYYRTRLTHSLEVAQIARSLCRAMQLNEDLGEVVSLAHDLGHPPFGHNGETALNACMQSYGGFNHNDQTLRVLTKIEKRHPNFDGLNLTWESLEGIVKHNGVILGNVPFHIHNYNILHNLSLDTNPHLESQIASVADDIAYNNHDVEDALRAKLITLDSLKELKYFNNLIEKMYVKYPNIEDNLLTYQVLRMSISQMVNDVLKSSKENLKHNNINSFKKIQTYKYFLIKMSDEMKDQCFEIRSYLYKNVYNHPKLLIKRSNAEKIVFKIFEYYEKNFDELPNDWLSKSEFEIKQRIICDYISGMTDRYASKLYKAIYD